MRPSRRNVRDHNGQQIAAGRIALNIAKLPELLRKT
jgi:hypothetical protein